VTRTHQDQNTAKNSACDQIDPDTFIGIAFSDYVLSMAGI